MNPLIKLEEFLKESFATKCNYKNMSVLRAYFHAAANSPEGLDEKFVLGYIDTYAQRNNVSASLVSCLKYDVSQELKDFTELPGGCR